MLDDVVWTQVLELLQKPDLLQKEYDRRLKKKSKDDPNKLNAERKSTQNKIDTND
jgi:hypothetical protein